MKDDIYPEALPENLAPIDKFTFSMSKARVAKEEIQKNLDTLRERIAKINDKFVLGGEARGMTVIDKILSLSRDPKELKGLSLGLDRVSTLIAHLDELEARLKFLELIEKDPAWLQLTVADFETDIEAELLALESFSTLETDNIAADPDNG